MGCVGWHCAEDERVRENSLGKDWCKTAHLSFIMTMMVNGDEDTEYDKWCRWRSVKAIQDMMVFVSPWIILFKMKYLPHMFCLLEKWGAWIHPFWKCPPQSNYHNIHPTICLSLIICLCLSLTFARPSGKNSHFFPVSLRIASLSTNETLLKYCWTIVSDFVFQLTAIKAAGIAECKQTLIPMKKLVVVFSGNSMNYCDLGWDQKYVYYHR